MNAHIFDYLLACFECTKNWTSRKRSVELLALIVNNLFSSESSAKLRTLLHIVLESKLLVVDVEGCDTLTLLELALVNLLPNAPILMCAHHRVYPEVWLYCAVIVLPLVCAAIDLLLLGKVLQRRVELLVVPTTADVCKVAFLNKRRIDRSDGLLLRILS